MLGSSPCSCARLLGGEQAHGRAVGQAGRVAGGDPATETERRRQPGQAFHRRVRAEELVALGEAPPFVGEHRHRDDGLAHDAVLPRGGRPLLRAHRVCVGVLSGQLRKAVVQVLGSRAHRHGRGVDEPLGHEARVEIDVFAHRMVAHVLDTAGEDDVGRPHRDLARAGGDRGECARAHAVDGEARDALRQAGQERDVSAQGQALVADLGRRRHDDVVDPLRGQLRIAPQQLAHDLDAQVVRPRPPEHSVRSGPSERRADAVDEVHLAQLAHALDPSQSSHSRDLSVGHRRAGARYDRRGEEVGRA